MSEHAHEHEHLHETGTEDWRGRLRASGYRLTPQRELVLEAVETLGHATPDEVLAHVRRTSSGVNVSTVYRTLELLEDLGLVRHAHLAHGAATYHSTVQPQHVHLVCGGCGAVFDADPSVADGLVRRLAADYGFVADVGHLSVSGTCRDCAAAASG